MQGLPSILSLFRSEFNKYNNTRARIIDSIYYMTLRLLSNLISQSHTFVEIDYEIISMVIFC